jgi:diguanylate cyclase (GGDEF)-like protein
LVEEFYSRITNNIEMLEYIRRVEDLLVRDQLTGLYNRRYLFDKGNKLFAEAKELKYPLVIAILDVDFFKKVNDNYGHDIGDLALTYLADVMQRHVGKKNIVARFGGEEFCILAIGSNNPQVYFEMLRRDIEAMEIPLKNGKKFKITASIGLAVELKDNIDETLLVADKALYQAKKQGRNQVVSSADLIVDNTISDEIRSQVR